MSSTVTGYPGSAVVTGYPASAVVTGYPASAFAPASYRNPNPNRYYRNPNSNNNSSSQNRSCSEESCVLIFMSVLFALIIAGIIIAIAYETHRPNLYFSIARFEVSSFNLSTSSLSSDFNVSVSVRNPHKRWSVHYAKVEAAVLYSTGSVDEAVLDTNAFVIARKSMFPFSQRGGEVTDLKVRLGTVGFHAADEDRIRSGDGEVRFGVRVSSTVGFKLMWAWTTGPRDLKVYCDDIRVRLKNSTVAGAGSMVGPARGCRAFYGD